MPFSKIEIKSCCHMAPSFKRGPAHPQWYNINNQTGWTLDFVCQNSIWLNLIGFNLWSKANTSCPVPHWDERGAKSDVTRPWEEVRQVKGKHLWVEHACIGSIAFCLKDKEFDNSGARPVYETTKHHIIYFKCNTYLKYKSEEIKNWETLMMFGEINWCKIV